MYKVNHGGQIAVNAIRFRFLAARARGEMVRFVMSDYIVLDMYIF
jgi:hypothetical protein